MQHKLYYAPGACSFLPLVALEGIKAATGEDFEAQLVKLHRNEQRAPEFLALNFMGQVPVLVVDGKPLTQIVAIIDYLDRRCPQVGLLPQDPQKRTEAMSLFAWMNNTVHPTFTHVFMPYKFAEDEAAKNEVKRYNLELFRGYLTRIQDLVAKAKPYVFGDQPSVIDLYAMMFLRWGELAGIDPDDYPVLKAFTDRLATVPPVAAALERERLPLHTYKKA